MTIKTHTVYTVVYYDEKSAGPAGDCTHTARFHYRHNADKFAAGRTCYGKPAGIDVDADVPHRIYDRWRAAGYFMD
jgi:hypothetical protein